MEERFQSAELGGWGVSDIGGFVEGGIGGAAFEDAVKGKVEERSGCGGFDIRILLEIPSMVEKSRSLVFEENTPGCGQSVNFEGGVSGFVPRKTEWSAKLPCEARSHGIHTGLDGSNAAVALRFDLKESFAEKGDLLEAL